MCVCGLHYKSVHYVHGEHPQLAGTMVQMFPALQPDAVKYDVERSSKEVGDQVVSDTLNTLYLHSPCSLHYPACKCVSL